MSRKYDVAIICHTYNHQEFISEAIESFLRQTTRFSIQIIIHDDCSEDNTLSIVKNYSDNYSNIFVVSQSENQLSKGVDGKFKIFRSINEHVDSDYIALCEGDDYWVDNEKIDTQISFLKLNKDYVACTHRSKIYNYEKRGFDGVIGWRYPNISTEEMILCGGGIVPTASIVLRTEFYKLPDFGLSCGFGDYQLQIYFSLFGKVKNFNQIMSVYRINHPQSWTTKIKESSNDALYSVLKSENKMLEELNDYTYGKYYEIVSIKIAENFLVLLNDDKLRILAARKFLKIASIVSSRDCYSKSRFVKLACYTFKILKQYLIIIRN